MKKIFSKKSLESNSGVFLFLGNPLASRITQFYLNEKTISQNVGISWLTNRITGSKTPKQGKINNKIMRNQERDEMEC